ncbi:fosfomycin resistance protein FosB [Phocoenobacter uteri]|uniref:Fosfomycin resistance protein FosB n=1 Tax=Phocoenobacter uteri TaxID=146806 RepID=A0A379C9Y7_9PAST|nr:VOC family protein [Phocoenobacter uteri]MDG6882398.1 glyoxalase [Phocoenobacter uteri]SUB58555.1 fosfomycin resistance protein FosB [Phocoenobacter uteri]
MIKSVIHIGITVSDLEKSVAFYRDVLGLKYLGSMTMQGKETDLLFNQQNCVVKVAYLNGSDELNAPPIELLQFVSPSCKIDRATLTKTSISEVCFAVEDIEQSYQRLKAQNVEFLSEPQFFDFSADGFGKSKAVYFKDPDGIILELLQEVE